jgi:hypothetical protein
MTKIEKAHAVLNLTKYRETAIDRIVDSVQGVYGPDEKLSDEDLQQKNVVLDTVREIADETVEKVMDTVARVYSEHYTEEELDQLIIFYDSELGKKVLSEYDTTAGEIEKTMEDWGDKLWKKVRLRMGWA